MRATVRYVTYDEFRQFEFVLLFLLALMLAAIVALYVTKRDK